MSNSKDKRRYEKRELVFNKCNGKCAYCGCELSLYGFQIDHIAPKRRYKVYGGDCYSTRYEYGEGSGSDDVENLFPCCQSCNSSKSDLSLENFRERVIDRVDRLNKYSSEYQIAKRFGLIKEEKIDVEFYFEKLIKNG